MKIPKYPFSVEELMTDERFRKWTFSSGKDVGTFWDAYLSVYPHEKEKLSEAKALLLAIGQHFDHPEKDESLLHQDFDRLILKVNDEQQQLVRRIRFRRGFLVAATILLLGTISATTWMYSITKPVQYQTAFAEWEEIVLPDGSNVWLNANSEIRFQRGWQWGAARKVWLKGEAFFEVEKKAVSKAKFIVMADSLNIEVLGTAFNVRFRDGQTEVYLEEGNIHLAAPDTSTQVTPGERIVYANQENLILSRENDISSPPGTWKEGVLILKDVVVSDVFKEIEAIYGIRISFRGEQRLDEVVSIGIPMDSWEMTKPILERTLGSEVIAKPMNEN